MLQGYRVDSPSIRYKFVRKRVRGKRSILEIFPGFKEKL